VSAVRGVEHVSLRGELDLVGAIAVDRQLGDAMARGVDGVVVHLDHVTFIDSSGLRALLEATRFAERCGIDLRILPGPEHVMDVVTTAGLAGRLPFVGYP
jgi:anti-sigma B factor antagonist